METNETKSISSPPKIMNAFISGFNVITANIALILFPIVVDIIIWLGPKLKLEKILSPMISNATQLLQTYNSEDMTELIKTAQETWAQILPRINLTNSISTFPLGIPSLIAGTDTTHTPLGGSLTYEIPSFGAAIIIFLILTAIGLAIGSIYFAIIAKKTSGKAEKLTISGFGSQIINTYGLLFLIIGILLVLIFPSLFVVSFFAVFSPSLAQIILLAATFIMIWLLMPLVFSPHGIFLNNQNVIKSVVTSFQLVRLFLPGTGLFLLVAILCAQGLDILWLAAPSSSWLTLIGIFGHAFIYTSLIAASFIYYQKGLEWMESNAALLANRFKKLL
jgi:hypothetical protein